MPITERKTLAQARPNGHFIDLISETWDDGETWFAVIEGDDDRWEFDNEEDARAEYERIKGVLAETPNWAFQAEYDEQWGAPLTPWWNEH